MKSILEKQLQRQLDFKSAGAINHTVPTMLNNTGDAYDYLVAQKQFLDEEFAELLEELIPEGFNKRDIKKPWKQDYDMIRQTHFIASGRTKADLRGEAIDLLCFALNICLAAGVTPKNIEKEYDLVDQKNKERLDSGYISTQE